MAVTRTNVKRLPVRPAAKAPPKPKPQSKPVHRGPDVVVNNVEITLSLAAPFMFGAPLRLIEWLFVRFGIIPEKPVEATTEPVIPAAAKQRRIRPAA